MSKVSKIIKDFTTIQTGELWDYITYTELPEVIELSARVNSLKEMIDTCIKHNRGGGRIQSSPDIKPEKVEKLISAPEVGEKLGFSKVTIYEMINRGEIDAIKVNGKWRITSTELERLMKGKRKRK